MYQYRNHKNNPGNQPFNITGKPNQTKSHSNMIIFKDKPLTTQKGK